MDKTIAKETDHAKRTVRIQLNLPTNLRSRSKVDRAVLGAICSVLSAAKHFFPKLLPFSHPAKRGF